MEPRPSDRNAGSIGLWLGLVLAFGCRRETPSAVQASGAKPTSSNGATSAESPDIVLVSIDSLRSDHLGCYGYRRPTSPTIDALARRGVRCDAAISTTSWTLPAHAAMFTGLFDTT